MKIEYLEEKLKQRVNAYRSIQYYLEMGCPGIVNAKDIEDFIDHPIALKKLIKGKTRTELINMAKRLKIPNYGRKNTTQLTQEVEAHENQDEE
jgi:hypothetical protein